MRHFDSLLCALAMTVLGTSAEAQLFYTDTQQQQQQQTGQASSRNPESRVPNNSDSQTTTSTFEPNQFSRPEADRSNPRSDGFGLQQKSNDPLNRQTMGRQDKRQPLRGRPSEFSRYASKLSGQTLNVFGADFFVQTAETSPQGGAVGPAVPPDYLVNAGDELLIQISGPYEAEFKQQVRRGGDITLPRIGTVRVAGVRAGELSSFLKTRMETQFKNIQVSASFTSLHGMRVFVTGFVEFPGPHVVDSISSITNAIAAAGGPSEGGSYRSAELWRKGVKVANFDLYEFLVKGDSSKDITLTADDVIRVAPASSFQVALSGSVNRPAVYELSPTEGLNDLLVYAGGFTPVADRTRLAALEINASGQRQLSELNYSANTSARLSEGAVLYVFSSVVLNPAINATLKIVHVEGEVNRPGSYVMPAASKISDAIAAAGGSTTDAFMKGVTLTRTSLLKEQNFQLQRSLDELERSVFEASANLSAHTGETGAATAAATAATKAYIERLRQFKPQGRLILTRNREGGGLEPVLEDGDKIMVPPVPTTVSIYGAVYGEGSYLANRSAPLASYLQAAGGARPGADTSAIFVVKADGSVQAAQSSFFSREAKAAIDPGDSIFVPTDTQQGRTWVVLKDIGTLLYQFGLGAVAFKAIGL